jgi:hypothetical protein
MTGLKERVEELEMLIYGMSRPAHAVNAAAVTLESGEKVLFTSRAKAAVRSGTLLMRISAANEATVEIRLRDEAGAQAGSAAVFKVAPGEHSYVFPFYSQSKGTFAVCARASAGSAAIAAGAAEITVYGGA